MTKEETPSPLPELRQAVRSSLNEIFDRGLFNANIPAPRGSLRGIDVLDVNVVRQKLSRAAIIANKAYGTVADFARPKGYFEKLAVTKFFAPIPMPSPADKLGVSRFIPEHLQSEIKPVPAIWQSTESFDLARFQQADLPDGKYYLKANNGSGSVRAIQLPVGETDAKALSELTSKWLDFKHGERAAEWWYGLIGARIFLEADLRTSDTSVSDWKFHMGGGEILAVQVDLGRGQNHQQFMFTPEFERLNLDLFFSGKGTVEKPKNYDLMCQAARDIAAQFEFARVDFYNLDGKIFLGEITLAPMGGLRTPVSEELNTYLGGQWSSGMFSTPE